jgi:hypothetical protein
MAVSGQRQAPATVYPRGKDPGTHCTGSWVGPGAGLDTEARGKILSPLPGIEPRSSCRAVRSQTLCTVYTPTETLYLSIAQGRAIAQAVSRRLFKPEARVGALVSPCGNCGAQSGTETGFLRVLRFSLSISFHLSSILTQFSRGWIKGLLACFLRQYHSPQEYNCADNVRGLSEDKRGVLC